MPKMKKNEGFSIVEGTLVVVALIILGSVGYMAYTHFIASPADSVANNSSQTPVKIEKSADLDKASAALDDTSLDDSDTSQFEDLTNSFN